MIERRIKYEVNTLCLTLYGPIHYEVTRTESKYCTDCNHPQDVQTRSVGIFQSLDEANRYTEFRKNQDA